MIEADKVRFSALPPAQMMGLTIYGEAEGEPREGKMAVGFVIKNRADLWHKTIHQVCLKPNQFECFNEDNKRLPILSNLARQWDNTLEALKSSLVAAEGVLSGNLQSNVGLATFYKRMDCESPWFDRSLRKGTLKKVAEVGHHEFFIETKYLKEA